MSKPVDIELLLRLLEQHLHLEWQYAETDAASDTAPELPPLAAELVIPPSQEELNAIDIFVQKGDLYAIQHYAAGP